MCFIVKCSTFYIYCAVLRDESFVFEEVYRHPLNTTWNLTAKCLSLPGGFPSSDTSMDLHSERERCCLLSSGKFPNSEWLTTTAKLLFSSMENQRPLMWLYPWIMQLLSFQLYFWSVWRCLSLHSLNKSDETLSVAVLSQLYFSLEESKTVL